LHAFLRDESLKRPCETLWRDVTAAQIYVSAGLGPRESNEGFTEPFDLPNDSAYAETCASVALAVWAQRMLHLDLDGAYANMMERALYNGALSGLSREGALFLRQPARKSRTGLAMAWHPCPCCTMNVSRLVASVAGYFFSAGDEGVAIHLYGGAETALRIAGKRVMVSETSDYPWSGAIRIEVDPEQPTEFDLRLRIPDWARGAAAKVNGEAAPLAAERGYARLHRLWKKGDVVTLDLPMLAERLWAHPIVRADFGRVALRRGPLIYCIEEADNPGAPVHTLALPRSAPLEAQWRADLLGGATVLKAEGRRAGSAEEKPLYGSVPAASVSETITACPIISGPIASRARCRSG
jgi:uncharacterized protein